MGQNILPALKGNFGTTDYWVLTMNVSEFINHLTIPTEIEGWESMGVEEKFQRDINYKRIREHIAPYLATEEDRFIGAFIVEVRNDEEMKFQSLPDAGLKFPAILSDSIMNQFGMLILSGKELLVPLDGQHRLKALEMAVTGKDERGNELTSFERSKKLATESVTVMLVRHDLEKARKIFNKVNKYAKPTSKADNLITDDTNYIAVITRESVIGEGLIPASVVKTGVGNTLGKSSPEFTTLATIYEINLAVEAAFTDSKPDILKMPPKADLERARSTILNFWEEFLKIKSYAVSLQDVSPGGAKQRMDIRESNITCKPIVMRALVNAILLLLADEKDDGSKRSISEIVDRINQLDWAPDKDLWQGILMNGNKVIAGTGPMTIAGKIIAYMLGLKISEEKANSSGKSEMEKLKESFKGSNPKLSFPEPLFASGT